MTLHPPLQMRSMEHSSDVQTAPDLTFKWKPFTVHPEAVKNQFVLSCSGDLVSRLSNGPYGAGYGLIWGARLGYRLIIQVQEFVKCNVV